MLGIACEGWHSGRTGQCMMGTRARPEVVKMIDVGFGAAFCKYGRNAFVKCMLAV